MQKNKEIDWIIHAVLNGHDECDNVQDDAFIDGMCDYHTHGLDKYGSLELQFVLAYPPDYVGWIFNELGLKIKNGLKLKEGMTFSEFTSDEAEIKIYKTTDCFGKPIFRLIMPDGDLKYPESSDEYPYNLQYDSPYLENSK